jgi:asparagine synthase (glutamine-hydrolysing)
MREASGKTFVAVDRFAVRTLCYRIDKGRLRFAERAEELVDPETKIDPQAIFDYLYFHVIPSPRTIYRGIHRLPAGHCAVYEGGKLSVEAYWKPAFADFSDSASPDLPALTAELRRLLGDAVGKELAGRTGACFLSGGIDSSTIAGLIARQTGKPPATYSIGFDSKGYDEMRYARLASHHFGTDHHEYYVTPEDLVRNISAVAGSFDQPFGNSSALPAYVCALRARSDGVTQLLAGDGGDELFGGNTRYATQKFFGWYPRVPSVLRRRLLEPVFCSPWMRRIPLLRKGAGYIDHASDPMPDRLQRQNLLLRLGAREVLTAAFLSTVDVNRPLQQQREVWNSATAGEELDRTLAYDWRYTLAESDIPKVRGAAELAGISVAFPFLHPELVDFSMRLPASYKVRGMDLRWFFKQAMRGFLPNEILAKRKHGFGLPFGPWLEKSDPLRRLALGSLEELAERSIVRREFIAKLVTELLPAHPGYYGEMVWILMILEQWLKQHAPGLDFSA